MKVFHAFDFASELNLTYNVSYGVVTYLPLMSVPWMPVEYLYNHKGFLFVCCLAGVPNF